MPDLPACVAAVLGVLFSGLVVSAGVDLAISFLLGLGASGGGADDF